MQEIPELKLTACIWLGNVLLSFTILLSYGEEDLGKKMRMRGKKKDIANLNAFVLALVDINNLTFKPNNIKIIILPPFPSSKNPSTTQYVNGWWR